jgi:hypothetical protein
MNTTISQDFESGNTAVPPELQIRYHYQELKVIYQRLVALPDSHALKAEALEQLKGLTEMHKTEMPLLEKEIRTYNREFIRFRKYVRRNFGWKSRQFYFERSWILFLAVGFAFAVILRLLNIPIQTTWIISAAIVFSTSTSLIWYYFDNNRGQVLK